ncbi:MAG: multidrug effflux MFS transporter [Rhizobiaceae bacterium]
MSDATFMDRKSHPHIMTLVLATAFGALAMNLFLPALPAIASHYGAGYGVVQLSVTLYLASTAVLQLIIGPLSDRYGRRPIMIGSFVLALVATVAAIYAPTIEWFLACRLIQGTAAAGMVLGRATIRDMVDTDQAASRIGYVTMGMTLAPMIGPVIGGYLTEIQGWQSAFWLIFVFGLISLGLVWGDMGETNSNRGASFSSQFRAWPDLLRSRRFWGYSLGAAFSSGSFYALLGGGPFLATEYYHMSPSTYGIYFAFVSVGYITGNFLSGRYSVKLGVNRMMLLGGIMVCLGMLVAIALALTGFTHPLSFFGLAITVGLGNGISLPNANAGMVSVRPHLAGAASGLGGFIQVSGGAALSVAAGWLLTADSGPAPLAMLMFASAACGVVITLYVMRVARLAATAGASG